MTSRGISVPHLPAVIAFSKSCLRKLLSGTCVFFKNNAEYTVLSLRASYTPKGIFTFSSKEIAGCGNPPQNFPVPRCCEAVKANSTHVTAQVPGREGGEIPDHRPARERSRTLHETRLPMTNIFDSTEFPKPWIYIPYIIYHYWAVRRFLLLGVENRKGHFLRGFVGAR